MLAQRFAEKVVIVTGAAQGIGRACAQRFAAEGANVVLADRAEKQVIKTQEGIIKMGGKASISIVDLETREGAEQLMSDTFEKHKRIDISIHNVGGTIWSKPFWQYTPEQIEKEINRSLWPTLWCCHSVLPYMMKKNKGSIVNIGSVATRGINRVPYSAAKGGVEAITTCMAMELAEQGIRVNCVAPGGVDIGEREIPRNTDSLTKQDNAGMQGVIDQTLRDTPMKRYGTTEELAAAITFFASDEASYITGQTMYVAGGGIG